MWFMLKIRLLGARSVIKVILCEWNNFRKATNFIKIVSLPQRITYDDTSLDGLLNTVFLITSC